MTARARMRSTALLRVAVLILYAGRLALIAAMGQIQRAGHQQNANPQIQQIQRSMIFNDERFFEKPYDENHENNLPQGSFEIIQAAHF